MNKLRWLTLLMCVTILGIGSFQLYWLKQNYDREKQTLQIKAEIIFRKAIFQLQVAKLKLGDAWLNETAGKELKLYIKDDGKNARSMLKSKEGIVSTINAMSDKLKDSLQMKTGAEPGINISMKKTMVNGDTATIKIKRSVIPVPSKTDHIYNLLYSVDSLQAPLQLTEIDSAFTKGLEKENLAIPFSITRSAIPAEQEPIEVTIGFAHPATYKLQLGNTFRYLAKQLTHPILVSVLLLGITIFSFVVFYRSLLKQARLAEMKNEFISNITHELKTPIATVGVAIEALKNFNAMHDPERTREYLDISANELERLGLLVDKVLKLSMFEKQEVELSYETFNLKELVDEVLSSLKLQLQKHNAAVTISHEGDLDLQGDRLHFLSVIFNLLDNAIKYSKDKPVIQIELKGSDHSVVLCVMDKGIGIAAEYHEKVFDKFFRIPHGNTHNTRGYGLGLSYVKHVIQKHNGTIELQSEPGVGTKFTVTLPKTIT